MGGQHGNTSAELGVGGIVLSRLPGIPMSRRLSQNNRLEVPTLLREWWAQATRRFKKCGGLQFTRFLSFLPLQQC